MSARFDRILSQTLRYAAHAAAVAADADAYTSSVLAFETFAAQFDDLTRDRVNAVYTGTTLIEDRRTRRIAQFRTWLPPVASAADSFPHDLKDHA